MARAAAAPRIRGRVMWPSLFDLRLLGLNVSLPTYGALVALGFTAGLWLAVRAARRQGLPERDVVDIGLWLLVAGVVGARLLYVALHAPEYAAECRRAVGIWRAIAACTRAVQVWEGGLVFYGGFLFAALLALWLARRRGIGFLRLADILAPAVSIAHFFGRVGCFLAGCCWGKVCHLPFGVRFPASSLAFPELARRGEVSWAAVRTPPLHPTQLYEALGELSIFALLIWLGARKRFAGHVLLAYAAGYAVLRFVVEIFRGDAGRGYAVRLPTPAFNRWLGLDGASPSLLSTSQLVAILAILAVAVTWRLLRRRAVGAGPRQV